MSACTRLDDATLLDYAAGDLGAPEAAALEDHLFACGDCASRAAALEALVHTIGAAARSGDVGGFVTDDVLNQLARDGVRLRTFALSPGAVVPCAVWDDDQLMVLRLRGLSGATRVTFTQHVAGQEVARASGEVPPGADELIVATPAAWVRQLPVVHVDLRLLAHDDGGERVLASYTLEHGGTLAR